MVLSGGQGHKFCLDNLVGGVDLGQVVVQTTIVAREIVDRGEIRLEVTFLCRVGKKSSHFNGFN